MVQLMLHGAGQQLFAAGLEPLALDVLGAQADLHRALDVLAESGNRQAAFLAHLAAVLFDDFGVDQHHSRGRILAGRSVDDRQTPGDPDLRRGEAQPLGGIHRLEHALDQFAQFAGAEFQDRFGRRFQNRIAVLDDSVNRGLRPHLVRTP